MVAIFGDKAFFFLEEFTEEKKRENKGDTMWVWER